MNIFLFICHYTSSAPQGYWISSLIVIDWLEPLSDEWEDTIINPLSDDQQNIAVQYSVRELSPRKLRSIRKATGGGNDGLQLAGYIGNAINTR